MRGACSTLNVAVRGSPVAEDTAVVNSTEAADTRRTVTALCVELQGCHASVEEIYAWCRRFGPVVRQIEQVELRPGDPLAASDEEGGRMVTQVTLSSIAHAESVIAAGHAGAIGNPVPLSQTRFRDYHVVLVGRHLDCPQLNILDKVAPEIVAQAVKEVCHWSLSQAV